MGLTGESIPEGGQATTRTMGSSGASRPGLDAEEDFDMRMALTETGDTSMAVNILNRTLMQKEGDIVGPTFPKIPDDFPEWAIQAVAGLIQHMSMQDCEEEPGEGICPLCYRGNRCQICQFHQRFVKDMAIKRYIEHLKVRVESRVYLLPLITLLHLLGRTW